MGIIPYETIDVIKKFNDLAVDIYGIDCTLYIPNNLTALEPNDAYTDPATITYRTYSDQKVWVEWFAKDIVRLRKLGIFAEGELPIIAYFKNYPEVTIKSYIKVPMRYIPGTFNDNDCFEVVDEIMIGTYNTETIRKFKLAPQRRKV